MFHLQPQEFIHNDTYHSYKTTKSWVLQRCLERLPVELQQTLIALYRIPEDLLLDPTLDINVTLIHEIHRYLKPEEIREIGAIVTGRIMGSDAFKANSSYITDIDSFFIFTTEVFAPKAIERNYQYDILKCTPDEFIYQVKTKKEFREAMKMNHVWNSADMLGYQTQGTFAHFGKLKGRKIKDQFIGESIKDGENHTNIHITFH